MRSLKILLIVGTLLCSGFLQAQLISNTTFTTPSSGWYRVGDWDSGERGSVRVVVSLRGGAHTPQSLVIDAFKTWSTGLHMDIKGVNNHYLEQVRITYDGSKYHIEIYVDRAIVNNAHIHLYALEGQNPGFSINSGVLAAGGGTVQMESEDIIFKTQLENHLDLNKGLTIGGVVGIGTKSPAATLDVRGTLVLDRGANASLFTGTGNSELFRYLSVLNSPNYTSASGLKAGGILVADSYSYADPGKNDVIVKGKVGIGTTTPTEKLEVNGTIRSKEVKVEASPWPDYVFEPSYKLRSLEEIEEFIKSNNHLPDVPSAAEVEENGIAVGEMNAVLLRKIEELTLYTISQEAKIEKLTQANSQQQEANSQLLLRLEKLEERLKDEE